MGGDAGNAQTGSGLVVDLVGQGDGLAVRNDGVLGRRAEGQLADFQSLLRRSLLVIPDSARTASFVVVSER
jgi:hypothetical protein